MRIQAKQLTFASIAIVFIILISALNDNNIWTVATLCLYVILITYCSTNADKHMVLLMFSGCFFVFLVGGTIVTEYFGYDMSYQYSEENYNYMLFAIFLSLSFVFIGYLMSEKIRFKSSSNSVSNHTINSADSDDIKRRLIRKISLYSHYVFLIPYVLVLLEGIIVVSRFGYFEYYAYESNLPYIVTEIADLYIVALFVFLSTIPEKKKAKIPLIIFFILNCVSLLTGRRIYFVVDNLIIICYGFFRNKLDPNDKWITKRHIVLMVLSLPAVAIFLYTYNYIRMGTASKAESLADGFFLFFRQQGFSANLIPLGKMYASSLSDDIYSIYDILRNIRLNPIVRLLTNSSYRSLYTGSREALALNSGSFARAISYAVVRVRYLGGYGMGSCYIAELFHDFGYAGICIGNLIYGLTIAKINSLNKDRIIGNTLILLMLRGFFKAPRYCYDSPYYPLMAFEMWIFIAFVYGITNMVMKRRK